jgi:hypothetical protein
MTTHTSPATQSTRLNLWIDLGLFAAIMVALAPNFTGLSVHEWLGIGLGAGLAVHLLLHWRWLTAVLRRFFGPLPAAARLNLLLNTALFIDMVIIIFTGLLISREALPLLGLSLDGGRHWSGLHKLAADLSLALAGLHVAVHWKWILNAGKRYLVGPVAGLFGRPKSRPQPTLSAPKVN